MKTNVGKIFTAFHSLPAGHPGHTHPVAIPQQAIPTALMAKPVGMETESSSNSQPPMPPPASFEDMKKFVDARRTQSNPQPPTPPPASFEDMKKFVDARRTQDPRIRKSIVASLGAGVSQLVPSLRPALRRTVDPGLNAPIQIGTEHMTPAEKSEAAQKVLNGISDRVKEVTKNMTPASIREGMSNQYKTLRLMDADGQWKIPELEALDEYLLPKDLGPEQMNDYIDQVAGAVSDNGALMNFLAAASLTEFEQLSAKVEAEGDEVFPEVLHYSQMLNRLTKAIGDDPTLLKALRKNWEPYEKDPNFAKTMNLFGRVKLPSVRAGTDKWMETRRTGNVDPNSYAGVLPANIWEAEVAGNVLAGGMDEPSTELGHRANAYAGRVLGEVGPNSGGKATFSKDGRMVATHQPHTQDWNDLYGAWNMQFTAIAGDNPFLWQKLLIPEVHDSKADPGAYINKRAIALEIYMMVLGLRDLDPPKESINWKDAKLRDLFGKSNYLSAKAYEEKVNKSQLN